MELLRVDPILISVSRGYDVIARGLGALGGHSERVAQYSTALGIELGLDKDDLIALAVCALFHDCALTEYLVSHDTTDLASHCMIGQQHINTLPLPDSAKNLILYHHERRDGSGPFQLTEVPIGAEIINLADSLDIEIDLTGISPKLLKKLSSPLKTAPIPEWHITAKQAISLGKIISHTIDYKSAFTRRHTFGISEKAVYMAHFYEFSEMETAKFYLAACLHDLGKLATPSEVLEKPGQLNDEEFEIIKAHVYHTYTYLDGVDIDIRNWAAQHHEKLDGTGYPFGLPAEKLDFNSRLMACIDIYQAISEPRPYHDERSHDDTMNIMYSMASSGSIEKIIVDDMNKVLGKPLTLTPHVYKENP